MTYSTRNYPSIPRSYFAHSILHLRHIALETSDGNSFHLKHIALETSDGNRFLRDIIARLQGRLILGPQSRKKLGLTFTIEIMLQAFIIKPRCYFQVLVLIGSAPTVDSVLLLHVTAYGSL